MLKIGDTEIKALKIGNNDVKKVMLGTTQVWPVEQTVFEDTRVISDMGFINSSSMSNSDRVYIDYEVPFDLTPDSLVTIEIQAPNYNAGMYRGVALWLSNNGNIEIGLVNSKSKFTFSKKLNECTYWSASWLKNTNKFRITFNTNKTTTTAQSTYLGNNCSFKIRIDKM